MESKLEQYNEHDLILLHIPKTGGSSVKSLLLSHNIKFLELHVNNKLESCVSILLDNIIQDESKKIIITWRDPIEHVISCFYFYLQYPHFNTPKKLLSYINQSNLQNSQIHFMTHNNFLQNINVSNSDFQKILSLFNRNNTFWFLNDYFNESINMLSSFLNITLSKNIHSNKRYNFQKLPSYYYNNFILSSISITNSYDMQIYEFIIKKYNYTQKNDSLRLSNLPPYNFPLLWFINDTNVLKSFDPLCTKIYNIIKSSISYPYDLSYYITLWITHVCDELNLSLPNAINMYDNLFNLIVKLTNSHDPLYWLYDENISSNVITRF
jgi:hypothetical protein